MLWACLSLILVAAAVSLPFTAILVRLGHRLGTFDTPGVPGQVKAAQRRIPNTGGVAVFWGIAAPMLAGLLAVSIPSGVGPTDPATTPSPGRWLGSLIPPLKPHLSGIVERVPEAMILLAALAIVHVMGLIDDRRPLKAIPKLAIMVCVTSALALLTGSRMLTALDDYAGGPWLSYVITIMWLIVVTNAMNFLDNMDGLSGGIALIASAFFLGGTLTTVHPQWFIAASLALLIGSLAGFLFFNAPRPWSDRGARIFMGDGGSLVIGLLLAFLTVRTTYIDGGPPSDWVQDPGVVCTLWNYSSWYAVFMPLIVLAIPLYDFTTVLILRLRQGKNPLVGDLQHVSHRLVQRGLSRRGAVYVLWALTAATGVGAISLRSLNDWQAILVGAQTLFILCVLFALEHASRHAVPAIAEQRATPPSSSTSPTEQGN